MKLLLPLLAPALLLTACSSSSSHRDLWTSENSTTEAPARASRRELWAPPQGYGRSDNNVTRRTLYSPTPASGPYTASLYNGAWRQNGKPADEEMAVRQEQERIQATQARPAAQPVQ